MRVENQHEGQTTCAQRHLERLVDYGTVGKAARALCLSERTLQNELALIRAKLGVKSTLEAIVWAFRKGLVR